MKGILNCIYQPLSILSTSTAESGSPYAEISVNVQVIPSSGHVKLHLNIGKTGDMAPESKKAESKQFKMWNRQEAMPSAQHFSVQKPHPQTAFFQEQRSFNCWRWTTVENVEFKVLPLKDQLQLLAFQLWPHWPFALPGTSQQNWSVQSFVPEHSATEGKHYSGKCTDTGLWLGAPGSGASVLMEYRPGSLVEIVDIIAVLRLRGKA